MTNHKPEIMSPAGYWPQLHAAIEAGADAVYFGLHHFTARAKVGFTLSELPDVMRILHQRGVKGYITFNTLVFDHELNEAVHALADIAAAGADSIIVQDVAVAQLARQIAPDLAIHGSTQMSLTSAEGINLAQQLGVSRVVLARELSLDDIRAIRAATTCELEMFVHGALCVSYSGQCFSSEAWGGRSANRGQCAQACRLPYQMIVDDRLRPLHDARYLLSPGDLYALHQMPDIVGLGVAALKIEGRYKGLADVSIAVNVVTLTILVMIARRNFALPGPWRVDWGLQRRMVRLGWPLMLIHLLQTIFISIDVYLLRVMLDNGEEVVGWYNSAYKWFNALQIVPSFFTLALFPIISREIQRSMDAARRMYSLSLKLMLLLALPIAATITFLAEILVRIVGGPEFLPHGAIALQIVIWAIPIGWLNSVTNYVLIALGLERMQPRAFTVAVAFNVIANLLFIPYFTYQAAGVTTILSEVVLMVVFAYYLRQRMPGMDWVGLLAKPMGLTAVVVIVMALGSLLHPVVGVALGLLVYAAGLPLLRIVGDDERQILQAILPASIARRLRLV